MEKLPKDLIEKISNEFSPEDLILFCNSNLNPGVKKLCSSNEFWYRRLKRDFNFLILHLTKYPNKDFSEKNFRNLYLGFFSLLTKTAESLTKEVLDFYGPAKPHLSSEFKKSIYYYFIGYLLKSLDSILKKFPGNIFNENAIADTLYEGDFWGFLKYLPDSASIDYWRDFWSDTISENTNPFVKNVIKFIGGNFEEDSREFYYKFSELRRDIPSPVGSPRLPALPTRGEILSPLGSPRLPSLPTRREIPSPLGSPRLPSLPTRREIPSPLGSPRLPSLPTRRDIPSPVGSPRLPSLPSSKFSLPPLPQKK